ncbi:hypothetical protein ACSFBX_27740 [Variovorax sp. RB2P76]|uniref:hypothetical protein n=1 Tax=Variovorax sp. RB2P76 TaxID=3443736 RepID=UPI003F46755A
MSLALHSLVLAGIGLVFTASASAQAGQPDQPDQPGQPGGAAPAAPAGQVFTRARVRSVHEEPGGKTYVRLKLLPRAKLPFTVQTFRVLDTSLLAGISEGAWVKFTTARVNAENTVTALHPATECVRFQPCD